MSDKMRIEGISIPKADPQTAKSGRVSPVRPRHMIWLAVLGSLWFGVQLYGTPHLRFIYTYKEFSGHRFYLTCQYAGLHSQKIIPVHGRCPLFVFLKNRHAQ